MSAKAAALLLALGALNLAEGHDLTLSDVVDSTWKFYNDAGYIGTMKFDRDGTMSGYQNPNEAYWSFTGNVLHILTEDNKVSCKFVNTINDYYGKWHLNGRFLLEDQINENTLGWEHYLVQE